MTSLRELEREHARVEKELLALRQEIAVARGRKTVQCNHCKKRTPVKRLTYIQEHYYVEPYGCTGGDYWKQSEGRFLCPFCNYENRLIYRPEIVALKPYFGELVKRYEKGLSARRTCN